VHIDPEVGEFQEVLFGGDHIIRCQTFDTLGWGNSTMILEAPQNSPAKYMGDGAIAVTFKNNCRMVANVSVLTLNIKFDIYIFLILFLLGIGYECPQH
jgi:hypothetical protein